MRQILLAALVAAPLSVHAADAPAIKTTDVFIPWTSTLPADAGQIVALHLIHKQAANPKGVVLFVHGATGPAEPDFDLNFKDYNWMQRMAQAGYDSWAIDLTGYGSSPRPGLDNPCNADPAQQEKLLVGHPLKAVCAASAPQMMSTIKDEWREIDAAVDHIRKATKRAKIDIIGWSAGGPRVGGYVAQHGEKINRVFLYAPSAPNPDLKIPDTPNAGVPLYIQTKQVFLKDRWSDNAKCEGEIEPGVQDAVWKSTLDWDRIGAGWGGPEGVMRAPVLKDFGWTPELAAKVTAPTVVIVGEFDTPDVRKKAFDAIGATNKVFIRVACSTHFMVWEKQHTLLQRLSLEWLSTGKIAGASHGMFAADANGKLSEMK